MVITTFIIERAREIVYANNIVNFIKRANDNLSLLLAPPLYFSENSLHEIIKSFNYYTFYDVVKNNAKPDKTKPILLHLYLPFELNKDCINSIKLSHVILAGYTKIGIEQEEFMTIIAEKQNELKDNIENLNNADKSLIIMKPDKLDLLHMKIQAGLNNMIQTCSDK